MSNVLGGWAIAPMKETKLPEQVASGFSAVTAENLLGARYVPVLYVGEQVVAGKNYMILCEQTLSTLNRERHLVEVIINQNPQNEWSLINIDRII